jgi:hypothetical protein
MNWVLFLAALIAVESGGDKTAIGDRHMKHKAFGVCQIRQPYLDDVNRIAKSNFTIKQVRQSEALSRWCAVTYIKHYGKRYTRMTGKPLTPEVAARIHNGGPNGWKKKVTDSHWNKVKERMDELRRRNL